MREDLIERLRERAQFEDRRVLDEAKAMGFEPEVYTGSRTGALLREAAAALEAVRRNAGVLVPPEGYALVSVEMLRIWGKLDEVRECCRYLKHATPQPAHVDDEALRDAAIDQARGKGGGRMRDVIGYMVFEASEEFEQGLRLLHGDALPAGGILDWREGRQPVALFPTRQAARDAITRTEHYRLAFDNDRLPERRYCKVVPVTMTQETPR